MFTMADALALRERIIYGLSDFDEEGNERPVPEKRRKFAVRFAQEIPPPTVAELYERFKNSDTNGGDPEQYAERLRRIVAEQRKITVKAPEPVDLSGWAKHTRKPLDEILGDAGAPRPSEVENHQHPARVPLAGSRVPAKFDLMICANAVRDHAPVRDVREWLAGKKWAIVLALAKGSGKTVAACWGLVQAGVGLYVTAEEIAAPDGREMAERAEVIPFLILDDLGDEVLSDLGALRLRQLLTVRHANELRTAITTNSDIAEIGRRYGVRIVDRLRDGVMREYGGPSLRGIS